MLDSAFYRKIGGEGGRAGKGSEAKLTSAKKAANARWEKHKKRPVTLTVEGADVFISRNVEGLEKALSATVERRDEQRIVRKPVSLLIEKEGQFYAPATLLDRITDFFRERSITCKFVWKTRPFHLRREFNLRHALKGFRDREQRALNAVLGKPVGALCRASEAEWDWLLMEILRITSPARGIIVGETVERVNLLHEKLQRGLGETIGLLTARAESSQLDHRRITIMTAHYVESRIIPDGACEILVFDRFPRSGYNHLNHAIDRFGSAWRLSRLDDARRGHTRLFVAETAFGPVVDVTKKLNPAGNGGGPRG